MRRSLTLLLLLSLVCALPLQAYAQLCTRACASMHDDVMSHAQHDSHGKSQGDSHCAQAGACGLAGCMFTPAVPSAAIDIAPASAFTVSTSLVAHFPERKLSPLDRPPIVS